MKKIIAVLMTLCMLAALAACGNSAKETKTGSEDEAGKVVTGVEAIDTVGADGIDWNHMSMDELYEMAKKEGGTITIYATTADADTARKYIRDKYPDLKFEYISCDTNTVMQKIGMEAESGKPMADVLRQYVGHRNRMPVRGVADPSSFLFVKTDGTPGSAGNVYKWFRRILQECGIPFMGDHKGPRVHDLRHTFAVHALVHMARNGMDLYTSMPILSTCLGHRSLSATEQYVRLTMEMYPELVEKTKPVNTFVYPIIKNDKLYED